MEQNRILQQLVCSLQDYNDTALLPELSLLTSRQQDDMARCRPLDLPSSDGDRGLRQQRRMGKENVPPERRGKETRSTHLSALIERAQTLLQRGNP